MCFSLSSCLAIFFLAGRLVDTIDPARRLVMEQDYVLASARKDSEMVRIWAEGIRDVQIIIKPDSLSPSELLRTLSNKLTKANAQVNQENVISTLSLRIGSVFVLLFLVQILISFYRYNTRLANYYDARADVLQLISPSPEIKFETLVSALSPDVMDFGKMPATPTEQVLDLAKEVAKLTKTKD